MKSQIKRFSKSTLSVILSLCILVSCMTVGIIAIDAAYDTGGNEEIGATGDWYIVGNVADANNWSERDAVKFSAVEGGYSISIKLENNKDFRLRHNSVDYGAASSSDDNRNVNSSTTNHTLAQNSQTFIWKGDTGTYTVAINSDGTKISFDGNVPSDSGGGDGPLQRYIYCGISSHYQSYKGEDWGINFWGGTSGGVKTGTYLDTYNWDGRTYYMYRVQVYDDNNKAQFKGNDNWWDPSGGFDVTLNGTTNNAVFFSHTNDGWGGQFQQNYKEASTVSLSATSTTISSAQTSTLSPSLSSNADYNEILSTTYSVTTNPGSAGSVTSAGVFSATASGAYTVTATVTYTPKYFTGITSTATATKTITVSSPLTAPTIKHNNAITTPVSISASEGSKARITWEEITNAGSYEVFKDGVSQGTVTTLYYDIERGYSYGGTYTVKAIPSNAASYDTSAASNAIEFTFNRTKLNKPTVTPTSKDVDKGSTVDFTLTNTNTSYTAGTVYKYQHTGESNSTYSDVTNLAWTTSALNTEGDRIFKFKATSLKTDYFEDSDETTATINVSCYKYCLTGDMVTGKGGDAGWPTAITTYPVNTFVSKNVYYTSVMVSGGKSSDKHYFRLTNQSNQYTVTSGVNTDMASHDSASTAVTASTTGTNGAMYVTGNGTFKIYVNQNTSGSPKVWVVCEEWSITSTAYYQTYNLTNDAYNAAQAGTTGGTVSGDVEVVKGTSTTLTATPATGYAFDGWYSNTDFAAAHKVYSNASYTFTPSANGDYYALFKKIVNRYNVELSFTSTQANVSATYHGITISTNGATMSVPEGATVTYSISAKTGAQIDSVSPSSLSTGTNKTFTMPSVARTITVTSSWIEYTLNGTVSPNHGTLKFYEDNEGVINLDKELPSPPAATFEQYFWAVYIPADNYTLESIVATGGNTKPTRVSEDYANNRARFRMGADDGYIKANVVLQHSVTYYIDMHNTDMTGNKKVSIGLYDKNGTILSDASGNECKGDLTRVNDKTNVYSISIDTPFIESGSSYEKMSIKPKYNGNDMPAQELTADQVTKLLTTKEVWLEAVNEESKDLKLTYNTKATPAVQNGHRRIYLARPYNWCYTENNEQKGTDQVWNNIGIYYWGSDYGEDGEGWFKGTAMNRIGSDSEYCYYYVDIPKTLDHSIGDETVKDKVDNIIFQGWSSQTRVGDNTLTPDAQTEDIKQIADSDNFFVLSKNGSTFTAEPGESVVVPDYTRYVQSAQMNVNVYSTLAEGSEIKINPTYTGKKITYTSSDEDVVTVDANGKITPHDSGTATITVKIYGTIGKKLNDADDTIDGDYLEYDVTVTVNDPGKLDQFKLMALESQNYTVNIPYISNTKPGFFDINNTQITVTGISGASASTDSAIINPVTGTEIASFTVKYAKSNSDFAGYNNIKLTGNITTKSIRREGADRYGLAAVNPWKSYLNDQNETVVNCTTSKSVTNGQETVLSKNIEFSTSFDTYSAIFEEYQYVDVTFVYDYYEYVPQIDNKGTPDDTSDDMVYYQYQPDWAGANGRFETGFNTNSAHNVKKTYTVSAFEVRDVVKSDLCNGNTSIAEKKLDLLVSGATAAIGVMPSNNYYSYSINGSTQVIPKTEIEQVSGNNYAVKVYVHMDHSPQTYSVYLNGTLNNGGSVDGKYYYQESAVLNHPTQTANKVTMWYAVEEDATEIVPETDPLLATGDGYEFRVKGDTYIRTQEANNLTDKTFNRSEVDFSHYEVIHRDNPKTEQVELVDYLLQNFYIADFFDPNKVFATRTIVGSDNTEEYKPEDPQFVGGGVVYFSVDGTSKLPRSNNAVGLGYVNSDGTLNKNAVKEMLKSEILSSVNNTNYNGCGVTDFETLSNTIGEQDALKVAYGTEIDAHQYVENNIKTGVLYRYLPLETFSNDSNKWDSSTGTPLKDDKQNYYTTLNNNTFRYSNTLQSYQYVYASGNENKETNNGRNMRLYSYYVYSYVAYNQETNVPETKYEIVLSDNYSDASTYWAGNPNPNPAN